MDGNITQAFIDKATLLYNDISFFVQYDGEDVAEVRTETANQIRDTYNIHTSADEVIDADFGGMMEEVIANIEAATTDRQRERYCLSLITPFNEYSNNIPRKKPILSMGQSRYIEESGDEAFMEYLDMPYMEEPRTADEIIGYAMQMLFLQVEQYANMLDAAFVQCGIDLEQLQERCGVHLKEFIVNDTIGIRVLQIALFVGSEKLAAYYLGQLQRQQPQAEELQPTVNKELSEYLPKALQCDEAIRIFNRAISAELIEYNGNSLRWLSTKQLLAYFAERMSLRFGLSNKLDKDGNKTTAWKITEDIFGTKGLKNAKQNWLRIYTTFTPTKYDTVDQIFNEEEHCN